MQIFLSFLFYDVHKKREFVKQAIPHFPSTEKQSSSEIHLDINSIKRKWKKNRV